MVRRSGCRGTPCCWRSRARTMCPARTSCRARPRIRAPMVSGLLIRLDYSRRPSCRRTPRQPMAPAVGIAGGVAEREAAGLALGGQRCALQHAVKSVDQASKPASFRGGDAVRRCGPAAPVEWRSTSVAHAELAADVVPAAILLIEILGGIGDVDELFGILVGIVVPAVDDIRPLADIGGDRRLRTQVLPALALDLHGHAGLLGVFLGVLQPQRLVALDELRRPQHAQAGAGLGLQIDRRLLRARRAQIRADSRAGSRPAPTFSESRLVKSFIAPPLTYWRLVAGPPIYGIKLTPDCASNRCTQSRRGARAMRSPGLKL